MTVRDIVNQKALPVFKLFSSVIQERKDSVCHCKVGRDQIRIRGLESLGIFSGVGSMREGSVTSRITYLNFILVQDHWNNYVQWRKCHGNGATRFTSPKEQ